MTDDYLDIDCTCNDDCPTDCKGECGCEHCRRWYNEYLSSGRR